MDSQALVAFRSNRNCEVPTPTVEGARERLQPSSSPFTFVRLSRGTVAAVREQNVSLRQPEFLSIVIVIPLRQPSKPQKEKESSSQRAADVTLWRNLPASSLASDGWSKRGDQSTSNQTEPSKPGLAKSLRSMLCLIIRCCHVKLVCIDTQRLVCLQGQRSVI